MITLDSAQVGVDWDVSSFKREAVHLHGEICDSPSRAGYDRHALPTCRHRVLAPIYGVQITNIHPGVPLVFSATLLVPLKCNRPYCEIPSALEVFASSAFIPLMDVYVCVALAPRSLI